MTVHGLYKLSEWWNVICSSPSLSVCCVNVCVCFTLSALAYNFFFLYLYIFMRRNHLISLIHWQERFVKSASHRVITQCNAFMSILQSNFKSFSLCTFEAFNVHLVVRKMLNYTMYMYIDCFILLMIFLQTIITSIIFLVFNID